MEDGKLSDGLGFLALRDIFSCPEIGRQNRDDDVSYFYRMNDEGGIMFYET